MRSRRVADSSCISLKDLPTRFRYYTGVLYPAIRIDASQQLTDELLNYYRQRAVPDYEELTIYERCCYYGHDF